MMERRRRSKTNEEFGVLRNVIPACVGQEMHKLAILQASIEYIRYLEQCVSDLKAVNKARLPSASRRPSQASPNANSTTSIYDRGADDKDISQHTPTPSSYISSSTAPSVIRPPAILSSNHLSTLPSPSFEALQRQHFTTSLKSFSTFVPTSPALLPPMEAAVRNKEDHEAISASPVVDSDLRSREGKGRGGGLSVRELLRD